MSSNLNSGYTGQDNTSATHNTNESQGGLVDTIKSYIPGLSPTASRDQQSGVQDATAEPAFGAGVAPNASHSHTGTGSSAYGSSTTSGPHSSDLSNRADPRVDSDNSRLGSSNTSGLGSNTSGLGSESTGYGSSNTGIGSSGALGSSSTGYGSSTTSGPHSSSLANQTDPRVDSDNSRLGSSNTSGLGSSGALGSSSTGYGSSTTSGPHSSSLANQADPRVDSDNSRLGSSNTSGLGSSGTLGSSSTGHGSSNTSGLGSSGALGSSSTGYGSSTTTSGPHSSNLANKADPRVDSDNSRLGSSNTTGFGSSHSGGSALSGGSERDGFTTAPTLNPHDEERAKVVAARATGSASGPYDGGLKTDHGYDSSSGLRDGRVGESSGLGSTGAGIGGIGSGVGLGSGIGHESGCGSGVGSGVGLDSSRGAGYGSGAGLDSTRESGVGSGVGLGSTREHGVGLGSDSRDGRDSLAGRDGNRPSEFNDDKTDRATAGLSEGATAEESQASVTPRHEAEKGSSKRENKDAIPTAGGIKLGEKHWGESNIVPADPGARSERENISSFDGQPDQSTVDNTNKNVGTSSGPPGSGEDKEGLAEKVKHTLHLGGSKQ